MKKEKSMNRRSFLKRIAATGTAAYGIPYIVPSSALGGNGQVAPSDRVVVGSIGVGGMGQGDMKSLMGAKGVQLVAVCDVVEARRKQAKGIADERQQNKDCAMYGDFRDVLARDDIDAVSITTQDHWHALIAVAAAKAGKDMYCQKPLGMTVEECQVIRDTVRHYGRVFQTGTQQRSGRNFRFACELARNGYLGKLHTVEVAAPGPYYQRSYKEPPTPQPEPSEIDFDMYTGPAQKRPYNRGLWGWPDWYLIRDYSVGFIVNWGVHYLDIANWGCPTVTAEPCELEFAGSYRDDGLTDNINGWKGEFRYQNGLRMTYRDTGSTNEEQRCIFHGDKGWVHVNRAGIWAEPKSLLTATIQPNETHLDTGAVGSHYDNFIQCVRNRKDPIAPVEAGHQASYLGMIAEISIRLRRALKWDPVTERFVGDDQANRLLSAPMRSPWRLR
jgi:predicted dehydrogenase